MIKFHTPKSANWVLNPTKKQFITAVLVFGIGVVLNVLSLTNLFTESPFQRKNILILILMLLTIILIIRVSRNYISKRSQQPN